MPAAKNYLIILVADLKISLLHNERRDIDQSQKSFEPRDCENYTTRGHCEQGQMLIRKDLFVKSSRTELPALPLHGAIILGRQPDFSAQVMNVAA